MIARLPENYAHYLDLMADVIGARMQRPNFTPEECMASKVTYQHAMMVGNRAICHVPAMTDGGYFIIDGSEKVILIQEVRLKSELFVSSDECELFLVNAHVPVRVKMINGSVIELDTSMLHRNMRGVKSIGIYEVLKDLFNSDLETTSRITRSYCQEDADACMVYVMSSIRGTGGLVIDEDRNTLRSKMFAGMGDRQIVATLITMIVACVRVHLKMVPPTDRDDYSHKCFKTPGDTVYRMFKYCVNSCKNPNNLSKSVENHVHAFIKRGDVTMGGRTYSKMAIQLSRRSTVDVLSCVRKIVMPCDENSPNLQMRQIHASQRGFVCPCETPEGKTVGITKSLACCCTVSTRSDMSGWIDEYCRPDTFRDCVWIIVDGAAVGWCEREYVAHVKAAHPTTSVTWASENVVRVRTTGGRPLRPLAAVDGHPVDWNRPRMELLDPAECSSCRIASMGYDGAWQDYTHAEIHPCTMLGLAASLVPFPEHNQSARNVFSSAMIKQAMQMKNVHEAEKTCHTLQRPLVYTEVGKIIGYDESPNGLNLVTCVMSVNGFNQEDAIIVKKSSVERGVFSSTVRQTTSATVDTPWNVVGRADDKLHVLHGGTEKSLTEVISMLRGSSVKHIRESSADGGRSKVHVTMEVDRTLRPGDKMSSRHAQKGVVGLLMNDEDMPFDKNGIIPDIIINPHAIPSRMTVGQLIESVLGKSAALEGTFVDGTPFVRQDKKSLQDILKIGDTETLTLGTTGETVETPVAMGIVYYMALKHQAADKVYVRSSGPKSIMSRQPMSGRSKGGGLRFGEMEYDCLIAHGASAMVTEVSESSDMIDAPYCKTCKIVTDLFDGQCRLCKSETVRVRVPFSYVVLKDLLLAANIQVQTKLT